MMKINEIIVKNYSLTRISRCPKSGYIMSSRRVTKFAILMADWGAAVKEELESLGLPDIEVFEMATRIREEIISAGKITSRDLAKIKLFLGVMGNTENYYYWKTCPEIVIRSITKHLCFSVLAKKTRCTIIEWESKVNLYASFASKTSGFFMVGLEKYIVKTKSLQL